MHYTFLSIVDEELLKKIAKESSENDLKYFHRKDGDNVFTFLRPTRFPEKISSLINPATVADIPIIEVNEIDQYLGEIILLLDAMGFEKGLILTSPENQEKLKRIVKNTPIEKFSFAEKRMESILDFLSSLNEKENVGDGYIVVDQSFPVKGVGTVALGFVKKGTIKRHEEVVILPSKKRSEIRSIQVQDVDQESAGNGTRVGVALKNVNPDDVPKGSIIAIPDSLQVSETIRLKVRKNPVIKESLNIDSKVQIYNNFGRYVGKANDISSNHIMFSMENEIVINEDVYIISHQEKIPRIYGGGKTV